MSHFFTDYKKGILEYLLFIHIFQSIKLKWEDFQVVITVVQGFCDGGNLSLIFTCFFCWFFLISAFRNLSPAFSVTFFLYLNWKIINFMSKLICVLKEKTKENGWVAYNAEIKICINFLLVFCTDINLKYKMIFSHN